MYEVSKGTLESKSIQEYKGNICCITSTTKLHYLVRDDTHGLIYSEYYFLIILQRTSFPQDWWLDIKMLLQLKPSWRHPKSTGSWSFWTFNILSSEFSSLQADYLGHQTNKRKKNKQTKHSRKHSLLKYSYRNTDYRSSCRDYWIIYLCKVFLYNIISHLSSIQLSIESCTNHRHDIIYTAKPVLVSQQIPAKTCPPPKRLNMLQTPERSSYYEFYNY